MKSGNVHLAKPSHPRPCIEYRLESLQSWACRNFLSFPGHLHLCLALRDLHILHVACALPAPLSLNNLTKRNCDAANEGCAPHKPPSACKGLQKEENANKLEGKKDVSSFLVYSRGNRGRAGVEASLAHLLQDHFSSQAADMGREDSDLLVALVVFCCAVVVVIMEASNTELKTTNCNAKMYRLTPWGPQVPFPIMPWDDDLAVCYGAPVH